MGEFRKNNVVASKRRVGFHCYRTLRACACVLVVVIALGWSGQVVRLGQVWRQRGQRESKEPNLQHSLVRMSRLSTYENSVLVHQVRLDFIIRSFIRYFVIQGIVLDKLYLIKLRITNSKKRAIFLKIYFKYIDVYFHQEILILHIQEPKKNIFMRFAQKYAP